MKENNLNNIWNKIADDLSLSYQESNREALSKAIHDLPQFEAPEHVWKKIETELNRKTKVINLTRVTGIAASLLILLGLGFMLIKLSSNDNKIQYTKTLDATNNWYEIADTSSNVFNKIINSTCGIKPTYCASAEFKSFEEQYKSLELMQEKILKQANQYDNDSDLEEMLIRIENQKKSIEKHLIEQINS